MMNTNQKWQIGLLLLLIFIIVLLYAVRDILLPFILALALVYLFAPLTNKLSRFVPRTLSALLSTLIAVSLMGAIFAIIIPTASQQITGVFNAASHLIEPYKAQWQEFSKEYGSQIFDEASTKAVDVTRKFIDGLWNSGYILARTLVTTLITPIVMFFILKDYKDIIPAIKNMVPLRNREFFSSVLLDIDKVLARYIRGQIHICLCMGTFYATALSFIGLHSAIGIGALAGLMTFMPYIGYVTTFALSILSKISAGSPSMLSVLTVFAIGGILENYILSPKLLEKYISLSPAWIIFALMSGGAMFGIIGVILAIPVAATSRVIIRYLIRDYMKSTLYNDRY